MTKKTEPFGPWQAWPDAPDFDKQSFAETLDGGQAFRWNKRDDYFEGRWGSNVVRLRITKRSMEGRASARPHGRNSCLEFSTPENSDTQTTLASLREYLGIDTDFEALTDALPWRSDPVLKTAIDAFPGLRILRQPLDQTLFCFLCSSTKQIPQIKAICEAVATDMGDPLADGSNALPSWEQIADAGEARLRAAKLGYRAKYIHQSALVLAENPDYLERVDAGTTEDARELLMQLPGVGRKIADCTLLFGAGRLEAFPIDTWVQKILSKAYGLEGWKTEQYLDFARAHFGPSAGLAQQYLFAAARAGLIAI